MLIQSGNSLLFFFQRDESMASKFDHLLKSMLTKAPKPLGKSASKRPSSTQVASASYDDIQIPEDKFADASSTPKYESP